MEGNGKFVSKWRCFGWCDDDDGEGERNQVSFVADFYRLANVKVSKLKLEIEITFGCA